MMMTKKGATMVGYLRVSTDEQARSGLGLEDQRAKITAAAERESWTIVGWFVDEGVTGKTSHRPEFMAALRVVADGKVDGLVAAALSRVARSVRDFADVADWFTNGGKALVILDTMFDSSTAVGKLLMGMLSQFAEFEADLIAERTTAALAAKRARGEPISQPAVVDNPVVLARIRELSAQGGTLRSIAATLTGEGFPTLRGAPAWQPSAIQSALGYRRPAKAHEPAEFPEIKRERRRNGRTA